MKNIRIFHLKTFQFFVVKFSIYLNRRVFVMVFTSGDFNQQFVIIKMHKSKVHEYEMNLGTAFSTRLPVCQVKPQITLHNHICWSESSLPAQHENMPIYSNMPYIVKLGFTGVYIILLFLRKNIDCGNSLELPWRGGSNEYPQFIFEQKHENYQTCLSDFFFFWGGGGGGRGGVGVGGGGKFFQYIWIGVFL